MEQSSQAKGRLNGSVIKAFRSVVGKFWLNVTEGFWSAAPCGDDPLGGVPKRQIRWSPERVSLYMAKGQHEEIIINRDV